MLDGEQGFGNITGEFELCSMFTGIVEATGIVQKVVQHGTNHSFWIKSPLSEDFKIDQSVSHSGVCLTVEEVGEGMHRVTAIAETLAKTNLGSWETGTIVNIERCLPFNGRLDGHFVQGHVDTTGICINVTDKQGSWEFEIQFPLSFAPLIIEKGSVSLNGISLTVFNVGDDRFTVAIIPYTFEHTDISSLLPGGHVNLEFDILGKYIQRHIGLVRQ